MEWFLAVAIAVVVWVLLQSGRAGTAAIVPEEPVAPSDDQAAPLPVPGSTAQPGHSNDGLDNFLQAIFQYEGGQPGNLNVVNNNPGNLRSGVGQSGSANGFATFSDDGDGWDALNALVTKRISAHPDWDFYDFFNYYLRGSTTAPPVDAQGDSNAYAEYVANFVGVDPSTPVSEAV